MNEAKKGASQLTGQLKVTQKLSDYEYGVSLMVMRDGVNRNNWDYQNIEEHYRTFAGKPILIAYLNDGMVIGDGHNMELKRDSRNGELYYSFTDGTSERIVGIIGEDESDLRIIEENGQKWLQADGKIFSFYAKELVDEIIRTGVFEVSAETDIQESYTDGDVEVFTSWKGLGVTILGKGVAPAIQGARIEALSALEDEFKALKLKAASYNNAGQAQEEKEDDGNVQDEPADNEEQSKKGVNNSVRTFSKKQCAELSTHFEGYTVLAAFENEENTHVCLISESGELAGYTMAKGADYVVPANIVKHCASIVYRFDGDVACEVEPSAATDELSAKLVKANAALEVAENALAETKATVEAMVTAENKRRVDTAKMMAKKQLEEINANKCEDEVISEEMIAPVLNSADKGEFTDIVDENGVWVGDKRAMSAVRDVAMLKQMEIDRNKANAHKKKYIFEQGGGFAGNGADNTLEGLYADIASK